MCLEGQFGYCTCMNTIMMVKQKLKKLLIYYIQLD